MTRARSGRDGICIALDGSEHPLCTNRVATHGFCKGHASQRDQGRAIRPLTGKEDLRTRVALGMFAPRRMGCEASVRDPEVLVAFIYPLDKNNEETKGFCVFSPEQAPLIEGQRWSLRDDGYLIRHELDPEAGRATTRLHVFLLNVALAEAGLPPIPEGMEVDHINRDRGDNRLENLEVVTRAENRQNGNKRPAGEEHLRGVTQETRENHTDYLKWYARVQVSGKVIRQGPFDTDLEASAAAKLLRAEHHPYSAEGRQARLK